MPNNCPRLIEVALPIREISAESARQSGRLSLPRCCPTRMIPTARRRFARWSQPISKPLSHRSAQHRGTGTRHRRERRNSGATTAGGYSRLLLQRAFAFGIQAKDAAHAGQFM
ncbi:MAG: hypothetical protein ACLFVO_18130 [Chloroflexaceae bacterium]